MHNTTLSSSAIRTRFSHFLSDSRAASRKMGFSKHQITAIHLLMLLVSCATIIVVFAPKASSSLTSLGRLLQGYGLPPGIFPDNVRSFNVDFYGRLTVYLDRPCYAKYQNVVYFEKVVRANLSYGELLGMEGLAEKELFLWLPVKSIIVDDPNSGVLMIDIGYAHEEIALSIFEEPPVCRSSPASLGDDEMHDDE